MVFLRKDVYNADDVAYLRSLYKDAARAAHWDVFQIEYCYLLFIYYREINVICIVYNVLGDDDVGDRIDVMILVVMMMLMIMSMMMMMMMMTFMLSVIMLYVFDDND